MKFKMEQVIKVQISLSDEVRDRVDLGEILRPYEPGGPNL